MACAAAQVESHRFCHVSGETVHLVSPVGNEEHEAGVRCVAVPILLDTAKKIGRYYSAK